MNVPASDTQLRRKRSMRSLFVMLFLGVVAVLILLVRARIRGPSDPEEFLEALTDASNDVALVAYSVGADGAPDVRDPVVMHHAQQRMPLAAVARIPLLLAYAQAVQEGVIAADQPVSVAAWERHHLTGADGGAHAIALRAFGLRADAKGFAVEPKREVTFDKVVEAMIKHNDIAAADFVLSRLTTTSIDQALHGAGLIDHDPLLPTAGFFLAASSADNEAGAKAVLANGRQALAQTVAAAAARFDKEEAGTAAQREWLDKHPTPGVGVQALWADQAMTQGVPGQYAALLAKVGTGQWGTPKSLAIVQRHLGWPLALEGNDKLFSAFGSKGGTSVSIMTEAMYAVPKAGDFAGKTRVVVFLHRRMAAMRWFAVVRSFVHQQFLMKVALDKAFAEKTKQALTAAAKAP